MLLHQSIKIHFSPILSTIYIAFLSIHLSIILAIHPELTNSYISSSLIEHACIHPPVSICQSMHLSIHSFIYPSTNPTIHPPCTTALWLIITKGWAQWACPAIDTCTCWSIRADRLTVMEWLAAVSVPLPLHRHHPSLFFSSFQKQIQKQRSTLHHYAPDWTMQRTSAILIDANWYHSVQCVVIWCNAM